MCIQPQQAPARFHRICKILRKSVFFLTSAFFLENGTPSGTIKILRKSVYFRPAGLGFRSLLKAQIALQAPEIEINLENLVTKSEIPINNFRLIGKIEKGKFINISAKSEFSKDKYLDISLKKDPNNKKILEIYSDVPKALLADYKFFEGLKDGKLFFNSVIDEDGSVSKITIENFKVVKAPAFATLLTLADLGGVADLLSGEGMSFDILEISLNENKDVTKIEEILALGSSISVIMDGYTEKKTGLISLSGTLVPAKTLNSLVSKIPVVGNILVGDKVGEGVFGVSFKMKGLPGDVKTTVNPVKTLTPRFITRALEKMKKN